MCAVKSANKTIRVNNQFQVSFPSSTVTDSMRVPQKNFGVLRPFLTRYCEIASCVNGCPTLLYSDLQWGCASKGFNQFPERFLLLSQQGERGSTFGNQDHSLPCSCWVGKRLSKCAGFIESTVVKSGVGGRVFSSDKMKCEGWGLPY